MGECPLDPGGYFVVKGTEKVGVVIANFMSLHLRRSGGWVNGPLLLLVWSRGQKVGGPCSICHDEPASEGISRVNE